MSMMKQDSYCHKYDVCFKCLPIKSLCVSFLRAAITNHRTFRHRTFRG